jgi:hypothetical protein
VPVRAVLEGTVYRAHAEHVPKYGVARCPRDAPAIPPVMRRRAESRLLLSRESGSGRRWCCDACGNRARVAAHYRRSRQRRPVRA